MFLADTHSDTLFSLGVGKRTFAQTDITPDRLRQGGVSLQTLALWSGTEGTHGDYEAIADAEYAAIRHFTDAGIRQVDDPEDVKPGENTFMLSFEGCEVFQKSDEMVAFWRQRGIRIGALPASACSSGQGALPRKGAQGLPGSRCPSSRLLGDAGGERHPSHRSPSAFVGLNALQLLSQPPRLHQASAIFFVTFCRT